MNDPYDCRFAIQNFLDRKYISLNEYKSIFINDLNEINPELLNFLTKSKMKFWDFLEVLKINGKSLSKLNDVLDENHDNNLARISLKISSFIHFCSFSEIYNSTLMWSHYCNNHKGFCIEYDSTPYKFENPYINQLFPIIYTDQLFDMSNYFYVDSVNIKNKDFNPLYPKYSLIHKSLDWSYEKEWRVIYSNGNLKQPSNLPTPPISSILLGCNFFQQQNNEDLTLAMKLIDHCRKDQIQIKLMQKSNVNYSLEAKNISYEDCYSKLKI